MNFLNIERLFYNHRVIHKRKISLYYHFFIIFLLYFTLYFRVLNYVLTAIRIQEKTRTSERAKGRNDFLGFVALHDSIFKGC